MYPRIQANFACIYNWKWEFTHLQGGHGCKKKYEPGNKNKSDNNKEQKKNNIDHLQISSK